jgi:hypothetical protein
MTRTSTRFSTREPGRLPRLSKSVTGLGLMICNEVRPFNHGDPREMLDMRD